MADVRCRNADLYSGAVTIIFASCGSSGNSAIMVPTCERGAAIEEHVKHVSLTTARPRLS